MRQKSGTGKPPAEAVIKDIRRATRRHYSAEDNVIRTFFPPRPNPWT
ncbi:MAG: hypothetical protein WBX25_36280 [Rhodomicrobium sp.]